MKQTDFIRVSVKTFVNMTVNKILLACEDEQTPEGYYRDMMSNSITLCPHHDSPFIVEFGESLTPPQRETTLTPALTDWIHRISTAYVDAKRKGIESRPNPMATAISKELPQWH